ncbi:glycosyl transferase family 36 [Hymenobacter aquaticus]|uniref:Glycosyl transferase family 36 n=1 Tax=Hymenobacter aquaticus TaxID=1867101 RepID=A0A4Z0Q7Y5_9BACT|nr:glycosyl transferase family 36 [Hymenobacter aquaticus]TGE25825.1 glycosyl transferase family 36 [Hymenobacter aquaticus]
MNDLSAPSAAPTTAPAATPPGPAYGHFSADSREYIITDPRTPRPWFNYMWNEQYAGLISHTGGGFSFLESPRDNRLTRMRYNCLPWDRPGRYIMVKDAETGQYWSLSWAPTIELKYDRYECRHGQGYTTIVTEINGVRGELTYFVPTDVNAEVWRVKLTDLSGRARQLEVYAFTELMMGNALNDIINQPNDKHFTDIHFQEDLQALECTRRYWVLNKKVSVAQPNIGWDYHLYFTLSLPVTGFDGSLDKFIGRWRSEANPECVETGRMHNTEITAGDPVAALQSKLTLQAGESVDFAAVMAVVKKDEDVRQHAAFRWEELRDTAVLDKKLAAVRAYWDDYLGHIRAQTPDAALNTMLNVWNPYQAAVTFDMARNSGYYHGGLLFGNGIRDQFQDILGMVITHPERVRARLLNALRFQLQDGSTLHNFFKFTNNGEKTNHSDTPLWLSFGVVEYLNETADYSLLDELVPFYDGGEPATVYDHIVRSLDFCLSATTERGLPKMMNGDWNDTLDQIGPLGKGETVWGAFFLAYGLRKCFPLLEKRGDTATRQRWQTAYDKLGEVTNSVAWDGEWYIRAFKDNGDPVGSNAHKEGKIFINSQTWSVISGLAPEERGNSALNSTYELMGRPNGIQICWPSFTEVDETMGLISRCVPGKKENGAIFNHASSWFVLASLLNGDVERGVEVYRRMLPPNSSARIDRYEVEPYVFAEYVTSPDHETEGQASHSWLTGTAVWMLRIGLDYILGFRTSLEGISIDPHIPAAWPSFTAERVFRGKRLKLTVHNPHGRNQGVREMRVNGQLVAGNFIDPASYAAAELVIEVTL